METIHTYQLIAFDLDGTLLDDAKRLPPENLRALRAAGEAGMLLVPATGRIPAGLPEELRGLPGLRYGILVNGSLLYDWQEEKILDREEISPALALQVIDYMDTLPVLYDCYQDNWGYISRDMLERTPDYVADAGILGLIQRLRTPVDSLRAYLKEKGEPVQKLQMYFRDQELRHRLLKELPERFPELAVTTSVPMNIELNSAGANKGAALQRLCCLLGIPTENTIAFGDGTNDITLLQTAGLGVAMANAAPEVKAAADTVTKTNEQAGVAFALDKIMGGEIVCGSPSVNMRSVP